LRFKKESRDGSFRFATHSDLIKVYMERNNLKPGLGGTPLPTPLGKFTLCPQTIDRLKQECFRVERDVDGIISISDTLGIKSVRRFSSRQDPTIWIWPNLAIDHGRRSVVCSLRVRYENGETFARITNERICRVISLIHTDCHPLIKKTGAGISIDELWSNLGFGEVSSLYEVFERFAENDEAIHILSRPGVGIFNPYPTKSRFIVSRDLGTVERIWQDQLSFFKSKLSISYEMVG
jgi:hypothetical protein